MKNFFFDENNYFVIEDYQDAKPFSSFLPGIAGSMGIPLWAFYVNRGQAIASFGIQDKNNPILEFFPANKSYQFTPMRGFRSFIKIKRNQNFFFYEPFSTLNSSNIHQRMKIKSSHLEIEEYCSTYGLHVNVRYFTIPNEDFAGLVRKIIIRNTNSNPIEFEILDGLPNVVPFGANEIGLKSMNYTLESWMRVENLEHKVPFYKMAQLPGDKPTVDKINSGNFYLSFILQNSKVELLSPVVDPQLVFGRNTSLNSPDGFLKHDLKGIYRQTQITVNRTPCGFFGRDIILKSGQKIEIISIIGHVMNIDWLNSQIDRISSINYIKQKFIENEEIINSLTQNIHTKTSSKAFDIYCKQTYLDNILRGGVPYVIEKNDSESVVFHTYFRKHGDLERDYNYFVLEPNYFSQGNGNYRDVNQNRRCEVQFNPKVRYSNILTFMNLIQADGYNPLEIRGSRFYVKEEKLEELFNLVDKKEQLRELITRSFSPGQLINFLKISQIKLSIPHIDFLTKVISLAELSTEAVHGEGYWVDHWTYNLDLIENYLAIYPEKKEILLFEMKIFKYYDNPAVVLPRNKKYILIGDKVKQIGSVVIDKDKEVMINSRTELKHYIRDNNGKGKIYLTALFSKLLNLFLIKFATLDPYGMGIEMEANKPGWYDALNGLPGIFGSSMPETYELSRLGNFLSEIIAENEQKKVQIPREVADLLYSLSTHLQTYFNSNIENKDFIYWDQVSREREHYRERIKFGFDGELVYLSFSKLKQLIRNCLRRINQGIVRAIELSDNKIPTYFYFNIKKYKLICDENSNVIIPTANLPFVKVTQFEPKPLPLFLEGYVRALKIQSGREKARNLWNQVRQSDLYDQKLRMYKLNASLKDQPEDIGRAKAFTPGWLENESIWMHMEYKYLLELLKSELYEEFFEDFKNILIPFQDPAVYGRSTSENSSFIVSSAFPDKKIHGTGFYARLSGATAEFLSIWVLMMIGKNPFFVENNHLFLEFKPILPRWLFDNNKDIIFTFLGNCKVTYHNPSKLDTFDEKTKIKNIKLQTEANNIIKIEGNIISPPYASMVREGKIERISVFFE